MSIVRKLLLATFACAAVTAASAPALAASEPSPHQESRAATIECDFSGTARFQPGVRLVPQNVKMTLRTNNRPCIDDTGEVVSASFDGSAQGTMTCEGSPAGSVGKATITWNLADGSTDQSVVDFNLTGSSFNEAGLTGNIASGRYENSTFNANIAVDIIDGAVKCLSLDGATDATFVGTASIE
jgi:hypothetical protein